MYFPISHKNLVVTQYIVSFAFSLVNDMTFMVGFLTTLFNIKFFPRQVWSHNFFSKRHFL